MKFQTIDESCAITNKVFRVVKVTLSKRNPVDVNFIETLKIKGEELASAVNIRAANNSKNKRSKERILINCISGILAEVCWKKCINEYYRKEFVTETNFDKASNQIDLMVIDSEKSIEVRSSFPRAGINFALFHPKYQFDVIGPYTNNVKIHEPSKDFYVRTLYPIDVKYFMEYLNSDSVEIFLTGGATWEMMMNPDLYMDKDFIPDDVIAEEESTYRVVPFGKSLDTIDILDQLSL